MRFELLSADHDRAGFACEQPSLQRFLRERALRDMRSRTSATHVLIGDDPRLIIGYYTLAAAAIPFRGIPETERKRARLSRYAELSATLIARLARDNRWKGKQIGEVLLLDALHRAYRQTAHIGAAFVIVDAIDESAAGFYESHGFRRYSDDFARLFLPMATLSHLFEDP